MYATHKIMHRSTAHTWTLDVFFLPRGKPQRGGARTAWVHPIFFPQDGCPLAELEGHRSTMDTAIYGATNKLTYAYQQF
jgi:hypothetical protein